MITYIFTLKIFKLLFNSFLSHILVASYLPRLIFGWDPVSGLGSGLNQSEDPPTLFFMPNVLYLTILGFQVIYISTNIFDYFHLTGLTLSQNVIILAVIYRNRPLELFRVCVWGGGAFLKYLIRYAVQR